MTLNAISSKNLTTELKTHPVRAGSYLLAGTTIFTLTTLATLTSTLVGTLLVAPVWSQILWSDISSTALYGGIGGVISLLAAATPYVTATFACSLPYPNIEDLPRYEYWGLASVPVSVLTLTAILYPVWSSLAPTLAAHIPSSLAYSPMTFPLVILTAITTVVFLREDLGRSPSNGLNTASTTSGTDTTTTSDTITKDDIPGDVSITDTTDTTASTDSVDTTDTPDNLSDPSSTTSTGMTDYTYNWQEPPELTFTDVGGMDCIKEELTSKIINPLDGDIERYREFGISIPNILFYGPPGTGKTYLAKALAGELGYPYAKLSASDVQSEYINKSGDNINRLFKEAEQIGNKYGLAVLFIDEIDALLASRGMDQQHSENKKVVDEFLTHLEDTTEKNILFIAATNHFDTLDSAAVRPGRIDKKINIPLPDETGRTAILKAQLDARPTGDIRDSVLENIASSLDGVSAAEIEAVVEQAARNAVERGGDAVNYRDLDSAVQSELSVDV